MNATGQLLNIKEKEIDNQVLGLLVQEGIHRLEAIESVTGGEGGGRGQERKTKALRCTRHASTARG